MNGKARPLSEGMAPEVLEKELRQDLLEVTLIAEIDLDRFGDRLQEELASLLERMDLTKVVRLYPAIFACFLVHDVSMHAAGIEVYPNLSIPALRVGQETGPAFWKALERLDLPLFEHIEQLEQISTHKKYVRRMQMHGGIPKQAIDKVMTALHTSSCNGAASGQEVA